MNFNFIGFHGFAAHILEGERIPYALCAIVLTMILGLFIKPLAGNANAGFWGVCDKAFGTFGDKLDRLNRKRADLIFRGFIFCSIVVVLVSLLAELFISAILSLSYYAVIEICVLAFILSSGCVWKSLLGLYFALEKNEVGKGAYYILSRSSRINLSISDNFGITRVGMGFAARSFDKCMIAPLFWYIAAGIMGAILYSALAFLSWRFGKEGFSKGFGVLPILLEKVFGFMPHLLAAFLLSLASIFTPTSSIALAFRAWFAREGRASYAQGGMVLNVMAWPLKVGLGGAQQDISGSAIRGAWVGPKDASAQNTHKHLKRAIYTNVMAHVLFIALLLLVYSAS